MGKTAIVAGATLSMLLLAGCAPEPGPVPSRTVTPTPSASATPVAFGPLVLPTCDTLFTDAEVSALMGDGMDGMGDISPGGAAYGSSVPELEQLIIADSNEFNCTWVLPASERGLTLSFVPANDATRVDVTGLLVPLVGTTDGSAVFYDSATGGDHPYTEAHAVGVPGVELWISVNDGFGTKASEIVHAAWDRVVALNPGL
jgi:hypothetical protein